MSIPHKILAFVLLFVLLCSVFVVSSFALDEYDEEVYVDPIRFYYYNRDGEDTNLGSITNTQTEGIFFKEVDIPQNAVDGAAGFGVTLDVDPELENGYVYKLSVYIRVLNVTGTFTRPDAKTYLNDDTLYFGSVQRKRLYPIPHENVTCLQSASYTDNGMYLQVDYIVNCTDDIDYKRCTKNNGYFFMEFTNIFVNSSRISVQVNSSRSGRSFGNGAYQRHVTESINNIQKDMVVINNKLGEVNASIEDVETTINGLPENEYNYSDGLFSSGYSAVETLLNKLKDNPNFTQNPLNDVVTACTTSEARFVVMFPDTTVPFFDDLKIFPQEGRVALESLLPSGVMDKFQPLLTVVKFVNVVAICIFIYRFSIPKFLKAYGVS